MSTLLHQAPETDLKGRHTPPEPDIQPDTPFEEGIGDIRNMGDEPPHKTPNTRNRMKNMTPKK